MAINWRGGGVFAVGLLLGAVGAAVLVGQGRDGNEPAAAASGGPPLAALTAGAPKIDCSFAPMVAKAGREDGTLPLDKDLQAASSGTVSALILSGKEAAAAGKARDAEVAFLMACRSAEGLRSDAVPLADAQYQLARHYAQLAAVPGAARRDELLRRAEGLYAASVQAYRQHRGEDHEKTRFAMDGLAKLQALKAGPPAAAQPAVAAASAPAAADATRISGANPQPPAPAAAAPAPVPAQAATPAAPSPKAKPVQEARSTPVPPPAVKAETPAPAAAPAAATAEPSGPTAEERQARREEQAAREAREREAREAARAAREVREREREERAERAAQRAAEREQREAASELGAPRTPQPDAAPAETVVSEPPATASGDVQ